MTFLSSVIEYISDLICIKRLRTTSFKLYLKSDKKNSIGTSFMKEILFFLKSNNVQVTKVYLESDKINWTIKIYIILSYTGSVSDKKKEKKILIHYLQEYLKVLHQDLEKKIVTVSL
jgi:hypothetical protein